MIAEGSFREVINGRLAVVQMTIRNASEVCGNETLDLIQTLAHRIEAGADNIRPIAWFDSPAPLRSGWAWGERALEGGIAMAQADVGAGHLFLFGPEVLFRAQPHGTFRFVFNGLYSSAGTDARIR